MFQALLNKVVDLEHMSRAEARESMDLIMQGEATPAQLGSFLTALRIKGETIEELTGFAQSMRSHATQLQAQTENLIDTCGTGGDGGNTFNISTASALVAAAGGARVAKHGNRAVSSRSGSADVLEKLGVHIELSVEEATRCLEETNLCFMFAPLYHQAMKHAVGTRREIGFRTVFNLLGPMTNPAGADRQIIGVYDASLAEKVAYALRELGLTRGLVVAGEDGLDEISVCAPSKIVELKNGEIFSYRVTPEQLNVGVHSLQSISGGHADENAEIIRQVFAGAEGADRDIVLVNSAAALYLAEKCGSLAEGVELARQLIDDGLVTQKLDELVGFTRRISHAS
ncbi:anthranilate phosphoribosyltransferase [Ammoniphilus oxalaticus]|uniref:Anthranilate phosphoribosyltransferase n=1 Tax=Ammoniphilus oxalaticus TaxID=66863 RepID=A0A419SNB8_9BACL|nr:anthranilate phosphoribosyltransferase [Ammoniphilus oxalaticus]RKD25711.1 anthranilate phosphoribosyltransferase [Ammoniphilus oxalaticus]